MIDAILNKLGYIREEFLNSEVEVAYEQGYNDGRSVDLTEDELCYLLAKKYEGTDQDFDKEWENKIFNDLKNTDGLVEYLRMTADRDIRRYFGAGTTQEQLITRGAFARTNYLRSKIMGYDPEQQTKIEGVRYS